MRYWSRTRSLGCSAMTSSAAPAARARPSGVWRSALRSARSTRNPSMGVASSMADGQPLGVGAGQVGRVDPVGQIGDRHIDLELALPLVDAGRGGLACGVGVEGQHDALGEALHRPHVVGGQRGAARGHGPWQPGLRTGDHVGVSLAHDDLFGTNDGILMPVEAVERAGLLVERRVPGVHVLGALVPGQDPTAERDRADPGRRRWGTAPGPGRSPGAGSAC